MNTEPAESRRKFFKYGAAAAAATAAGVGLDLRTAGASPASRRLGTAAYPQGRSASDMTPTPVISGTRQMGLSQPMAQASTLDPADRAVIVLNSAQTGVYASSAGGSSYLTVPVPIESGSFLSSLDVVGTADGPVTWILAFDDPANNGQFTPIETVNATPTGGTYTATFSPGIVIGDLPVYLFSQSLFNDSNTFTAGYAQFNAFTAGLVPFAGGSRDYDSRVGKVPTGVQKGKLVDGEERVISTPYAGASALAVNLTVAATSTQGFVALFANGITWPGNSSINWASSNDIVANSTIVGLAPDGSFKARCSGSTHVIIDTLGLYV